MTKLVCTCVLSRRVPPILTFDMAMAIKDCAVHGRKKPR